MRIAISTFDTLLQFPVWSRWLGFVGLAWPRTMRAAWINTLDRIASGGLRRMDNMVFFVGHAGLTIRRWRSLLWNPRNFQCVDVPGRASVRATTVAWWRDPVPLSKILHWPKTLER